MVQFIIFGHRRAGFVDRGVRCNTIDPGGELGSSLEFAQIPIDLVKHLLGEIFGVVRPAYPRQVLEYPRMVIFKNLIEFLITSHLNTLISCLFCIRLRRAR